MKLNKLFLVALVGSMFFASCSDNDDEAALPLGVYEKGFFVTNEGNGTSLSTVTFISDNLGTVEQDVYGHVNGGDVLGKYVQSIFFDGDKAFIISNGSNVITVVNRYTFKLIGKIQSGLSVPMYGVVKNGKAYVTNVASFDNLTDDYLAVINVNSLVIEKNIPINNIATKILEENGRIYVLNGSYGSGNSITVINSNSDAIEKVIDLGSAPKSMDESNGILFVMSGSYNGPSKIIKINMSNNQIISQIEIPLIGGKNATNLEVENGKLYYTVGSAAYAMNITDTTLPTTPLFDYNVASAYGEMYGFKVEDDKIYAANGGNFASDSNVYVYSLTGTLIKTIGVGVGPNGFHFND